ncbi:MAG: ATP-grasp domain-containing protein [Archangium sp.]
MLLLVEGPLDGDRLGVANAARALGHRVVELQPGATTLPLEAGAFEWGVLYGDTPSLERYQLLHEAARGKNVTLLNDVMQHADAMELDRVVSRLGAQTAKTEVVSRVEDVRVALTKLALPVFIKGAVQSRKWFGWNACVAQTVEDAEAKVTQLLAMPSQSRSRVLLREVLPLRRIDQTVENFPLSREYRLFVLDADILALGFYWPGGDPFGALSERELREVHELAHHAAVKTRVPWLCVDVGQLDDGSWRIIETQDPCCSALSSVSPGLLVGALGRALEMRGGC